MVNSNLVYQTMMEGHKYNSYELAHLTGISHYEIAKILIYLIARKSVSVVVRGVLPRRRLYIKKTTNSPAILQPGLKAWNQEQIKKLHLVK